MCPGFRAGGASFPALIAEVAAVRETTSSAAHDAAARDSLEIRVILNCTMSCAARSALGSVPRTENGAHHNEIEQLISGVDEEDSELLPRVEVGHEPDRGGEAEPDMRSP
jgi:hypothetical protein